MPNKKISELPAANALAGTEFLPIVQSNETRRVTSSNLAQAIPAGTYAADKELAALLDPLIVGAITRDTNGAATSASVVWPDGSPGTYTATVVSTAHPGAVDAYTVTKGSPVTKTFTQPQVTRDSNGAVTNRPAITVS